jgi:replication initiation and membrane attachment protein DnaB
MPYMFLSISMTIVPCLKRGKGITEKQPLHTTFTVIRIQLSWILSNRLMLKCMEIVVISILTESRIKITIPMKSHAFFVNSTLSASFKK